MQTDPSKLKTGNQPEVLDVSINHSDQGSLKVLFMCWVHSPFGYFRLSGVIVILLVIFLSVAHVIISNPSRLYVEDGLIEWLSFFCWFVSILICFLALSRHRGRIDRLVLCWLCVVFFLAAARELDAQVLLNPKYFGQFGVHYKTRWFLSPEVNIFLKLSWLSFFTILGGMIIFPVVTQRKLIAELVRKGDNAIGFFLLGIVGLIIGFVCDDSLRKTTFLTTDVRQSIEETAEFLGGLYFLIGTGLLSWKPFSERTGVTTVPTDNV